MEARFFAEQAHLVVTHRDVAMRMLYMFVSFVAIAFDFVMKDLAFAEASDKLAALNDGLRHGSLGEVGTKQVVQLALGLIEQYAPDHRNLELRIRDRLKQELDSIPSRILAEHFAKQGVSQELFAVAKELEGSAYSAEFIPPAALSPHSRGFLGVLLDYWDMDRKLLQEEFRNQGAGGGKQEQNKTSENAQAALPGLSGGQVGEV